MNAYIVKWDSGEIETRVDTRAEAIAIASQLAVSSGARMQILTGNGNLVYYVTSRGLVDPAHDAASIEESARIKWARGGV